MVGAVCHGRQPGRADLLPLSTLADHGERARSRIASGRKEYERAGAGLAQRQVPGAARNRSTGWGTGCLLPELLTRGERTGISESAIQRVSGAESHNENFD